MMSVVLGGIESMAITEVFGGEVRSIYMQCTHNHDSVHVCIVLCRV